MTKLTFPKELQELWDNTATKASCDLLGCESFIDTQDPDNTMVNVEIEHPQTQVRRYLWFCCVEHKNEAFALWPVLERQEVRFF